MEHGGEGKKTAIPNSNENQAAEMVRLLFLAHTFNPVIKTIYAEAHAPKPFIYFPCPKKKPFCLNTGCSQYLHRADANEVQNTQLWGEKKKEEINTRRDNFRHDDVFKSAVWPRPLQP